MKYCLIQFQILTYIRGGFFSVGQKHVIVNNKDTNSNFDSKSMKSNYLLYVNFNSLYPTILSQFKLPMGYFVELNGEELKDFKNQVLAEIDVEGDTGYYIYCNIKPISPKVIEKNRFLSAFNPFTPSPFFGRVQKFFLRKFIASLVLCWRDISGGPFFR